MSRNSEKAQSMLYRFREQQAQDMGLAGRTKGDRRPRMASSVSSLRECERWRADILKEISRKVSKIQDSSLTDYEVRDLNDTINQLFREKRHWETQIVNLGGANYKRATGTMVDAAGREVPGTRGYKYFGRAVDLPGVRELFQKGAQAATEESARAASFQMFRNQGPDYYGDNDEMDAELAATEEAIQREEWEHAARTAAEVLSIEDDAAIPAYPEPTAPAPVAEGDASAGAKRKSPEPEDDGKKKRKGRGKKAKGDEEGAAAEGHGEGSDAVPPPPPAGGPPAAVQAAQAAHAARAALAASFMNVFDPASLAAPVLPSTEDMGKILLERRKEALRAEYGV